MFDLRAVQVVILDEADRMFDLGFITDIRYIMRRLPAPDQRLNLLFSATLAQRVLELAFEHMNDPELVRIEPDKMTVDRVRQVVYYPSMDEKPRLLVGLSIVGPAGSEDRLVALGHALERALGLTESGALLPRWRPPQRG